TGDRYFDVFVEYAKAGPRDILIRISAINRGPETAALHLLPTLWFRNSWSWNPESGQARPSLRLAKDGHDIVADHASLGRYILACDDPASCLFTENETNRERLFGVPNADPYVKDSLGEAI